MIADAWIHDLVIASGLHDIGKVGVPETLLYKAGRLTSQERVMIEDHPIIGGECLQLMEREFGNSRLLTMAREIAYCHHEWWDGTGYPFRLEGQAIPLTARVVALADVYDALTTDRPYKKAIAHDTVREMITAGTGRQFDPFVIGAFLLREQEFQRVAQQMSRNDLEQHDAAEDPEQAVIQTALDHSNVFCWITKKINTGSSNFSTLT